MKHDLEKDILVRDGAKFELVYRSKSKTDSLKHFKTDELGEEHDYSDVLDTLNYLIQCRDKVRGGWKPNWGDSIVKYSIYFSNDELFFTESTSTEYIFSFPTIEIRDEFYLNYKNEIRELKKIL